MKQSEIEKYEEVYGKLLALYHEMDKLSSKKQSEPVTKFKIKVINQILIECKGVIGEEFLPIDNFDSFDVEDIPFNSDVVIVLKQYLNAMTRYKNTNSHEEQKSWPSMETLTTQEWNMD